VNSPLSIDLPPELKAFRSRIEATIKPYIKITAKVEEKMTLWQSKFGGLPYLPKNREYPKSSNGQVMSLLAQINFAEVPKLEPFPEKGILQFYIASDDDLYGMNFEDMTRQENFRILFFPEVAKDENNLLTNFDFLPTFDYMPVSEPCSLTFAQQYEPISVEDYQFEEKIFGENIPEPKEKRYEIYDKYQALFRPEGHKIGGYPYFTQFDPRANEKYRNKEFRLLLQIDTDGPANIMWGDAGVGNFFIREMDLQKGDFTQVMYNWDCA
jgi:uncharacterized protein YwqG